MQPFVGAPDHSGARDPERRHDYDEGVASKHAVAVAKTVGYAVDAAAEGDYPDALAWLATVEAIGDVLPRKYETKREVWRPAARAGAGSRIIGDVFASADH
jgi:hypothetical protein